jgi:hypothetical protein
LGGGLEAEGDELRNEAAPANGFRIAPVLLAKSLDEEGLLIPCAAIPKRNNEQRGDADRYE